MWETPVEEDFVFGPPVVRGLCYCKICGTMIFVSDAAPTRWSTPRESWCHYEPPTDQHEAVFGTWVQGD